MNQVSFPLPPEPQKNKEAEGADLVRETMQDAWQSYRQKAFGLDGVKPVSGKPARWLKTKNKFINIIIIS